jgi:hypothetical protein
MKKQSIIVFVCGCLLLPATGFAASFHMNPGKWQFVTTVSMPMLPAPQVTTNTECVTREEAERDPLANLTNIGKDCKITEKKMSGARLDYTMECNQQGMITKGKGSFIGQGDTASGSMEMNMNMPEMPANMPGMSTGSMTVKTSWQARRIGPCN